MAEARLQDGVPVSAGWFVLNARDAPWTENGMRSRCQFGGEGDAHFDDLGVALYWLEPGQPMAIYHHEAGQEDFLVLRGRCTLVVEGEERSVGAWDLVHCPPRTPHVLVGAGDDPALVLAVGARTGRGGVRYLAEPAAARLGAAPDRDTASVEEAYAGHRRETRPRPAPPL